MKGMLLSLGVLAFLASCGSWDSSDTVVLWSPDETQIPTGALGTLSGSNDLNGTRELKVMDGGQTVVLDSWRIKSFSSPGEAAAYARKYEVLRYYYGISEKPVLVLREQPDGKAERVYNLTLKEEGKVLDRVDSTAGYWYLLLASGGAQGWVFEQSIDVVDRTPGLEPRKVPKSTLNPLVEKIFSAVWRSKGILEAVKDRSLELDSLLEDHYFRGMKDDNVFFLRTPEVKRIFKFDRIEILAPDTCGFTGTDLKLRLSLDGKTLTAYFTQGSQNLQLDFLLPEEDLGDLVAAERAYRRELYQSLFTQGPVLRSPGQGEIYLEKDQKFRWIPGPEAGAGTHPLFQKSYGEKGTLRFQMNLSPELRARGFTGVLSLVFDPQPDAPVHFLYRVLKGGIQLWQANALPGTAVVATIPLRTPSYFFAFSRI